ncbi:MAG: serine/threonine protein kinase [Akkermansiaceae bacterium]|nr:serine/threonine protein kinase [Akkermansiaceae bacterium]
MLSAAFPDLSGFAHIKSGTFKTVHRVTTKDGRDEVLKVIRLPQDAATDAARAFRDQELGRVKRETGLLADLDSPFVVKLGSVAPAMIDLAGEPCVVYTEEMLPGNDLEAVISKRVKPTEAEVKLLLGSLVQGIQALWTRHKSVHRDIKPANIFATGLADRPYVLLDFGIAYNVDEPGLTVNPSHIPHTPLYMAPEMLDPNFRESLSYRADLYAAGVTTFEFATGGIHPLAKPHDSLAKTYTRVLNQEPTRLVTLRPDLPKPLTSLIDQLMKKSPALRPGNFALILKQLT